MRTRPPLVSFLACFVVFAALAVGPWMSWAVAAPAADDSKIVIALDSEQTTLDPHMHHLRIGVLMNINMYDSLLHKNKRLEFEPSLATSWKGIDDVTWEFTLRKGVKFHNGDPFSAEDVKFTFERVLNPEQKSPQYGNVRAVKRVEILDPHKIRLVTDKPYPLLLERLVFFPILPKTYLQKVGDQVFGNQAPVGTGPYKFVEWKRDQYLKLEAFDGHWRGRPAIKTLIYRPIPEVATQIAELKTGGVDMIRNVPPDIMPEIKAGANTYVSTAPILRVHYILFDMRVPPFDNKLVRQAASYAVDKQGIIQKMLFGLGREVATVVNPMAFGYDPSVQPYPYDPAKAKQLLAQAGYPKGLDVTIHSASTGGWRQVGEAVAQMLTEVGIRTNYKIWDPGPAYIKFLTGEGKGTHGHYWSWGYYSVFDADAILHALFHTEPGGLYGRWYTRVAGLDKLIDDARVTVNADKRKQTYAQIQRLLKEEVPALAMFHQYDMLGINKRIEYEARGDEWIWVFEAKIRKAM